MAVCATGSGSPGGAQPGDSSRRVGTEWGVVTPLQGWHSWCHSTLQQHTQPEIPEIPENPETLEAPAFLPRPLSLGRKGEERAVAILSFPSPLSLWRKSEEPGCGHSSLGLPRRCLLLAFFYSVGLCCLFLGSWGGLITLPELHPRGRWSSADAVPSRPGAAHKSHKLIMGVKSLLSDLSPSH